MSDNSNIEWTDATWNPVTGCTKVSPGCDHCYAETFAERFRGTPGHYFERGFDVQLRPEKLDQPLRWKRPRRIFVNSMSDLFHDQVPDEYIARVFAVMALAQHHTFQLLTKRHARLRALLSSGAFRDHVEEAIHGRVAASSPAHVWHANWPLPNVWLGVSVENQQWADIRIPVLSATPAAVRFLSMEPLLGPVDLSGLLHGTEVCTTCGGSGSVAVEGGGSACPACDYDNRISMGRRNIDWVIVGGESGRGARPMHPDWARSLRDQCTAAGVPFLFKQWGEWVGASIADSDAVRVTYDGRIAGHPLDGRPEGGSAMVRVGKKAAGRELDGRTWDEYPAAVTA